MTKEKLQYQGWLNSEKQLAIYQKYPKYTYEQLMNIPEIIELKKEMKDIKSKLAQLK